MITYQVSLCVVDWQSLDVGLGVHASPQFVLTGGRVGRDGEYVLIGNRDIYKPLRRRVAAVERFAIVPTTGRSSWNYTVCRRVGQRQYIAL